MYSMKVLLERVRRKDADVSIRTMIFYRRAHRRELLARVVWRLWRSRTETRW